MIKESYAQVCCCVGLQDDNVAEIRAREKAVTGYLKVQRTHTPQ